MYFLQLSYAFWKGVLIDTSWIYGTGHKPLAELKYGFVQVNYPLPNTFLQVNPTLLKVKQEQLRNMIIDFCRFEFIALVNY